MAKPVIYIETSVIGYYTARTSRDVIFAGHQAVTRQWWKADLPKFKGVISQVVLDEIAAGDSEAAAERLAAVKSFDVLDLAPQVVSLARQYFDEIALPESCRADSLHLALATVHGVDYLASWNCRHIASARVRRIVESMNDRRKLATPLICTPEELLEF